MELRVGNVAGVVVLVIVAIAIVVFIAFPSLIPSGLGLGGSRLPSSFSLPSDTSFLAVLVKGGAEEAVYLGSESGIFSKLPPLPEGNKVVTASRGGTVLTVLTESSTGEDVIYQYIDGAYVERYRGNSLVPFLEVGPANLFIGFVREQGASLHAYALTLGTESAIDLGEGSAIRFFIHDGKTGAWVANGTELSFHLLSGDAWGGTVDAYTSDADIVMLATNGASRFAIRDANGRTEEQVITSLSPFAYESLGSYEPSEYSSLFFKGDGFYGLTNGNGNVDGALFALSSQESRVSYPFYRNIRGIDKIFVLSP
jgi:hypothetical protein